MSDTETGTDPLDSNSLGLEAPFDARPTPEDPFPAPRESLDLADPAVALNRELSWVDFNDRVLQLSERSDQPLLERVKFSAIYSSNLDEFFMIRVAGLLDQVDAGVDRKRGGFSPSQTIDQVHDRVLPQVERQARLVDETLLPELAEHGVEVVGLGSLSEDERAELAERFKRQVLPVLTPLAVGLGRPFPYISNLSLSLAVLVRDPQTDQTIFARVKVPKGLIPRFFPISEGESRFVLLEELIAANLQGLFPEMEVIDHGCFRVTRDADFDISDEADDLLKAIEAELRQRPFGEVVRLELEAGISPAIREQLVEALMVEERQIYSIPGLLDMTDLWQLVKLPGHSELRDAPATPLTQPRLAEAEADERSIFSVIREGDVLVHHPYESFSTSVERFVQEAVEDPDVLAIKQTVYRTSDDSPLVPSLIRATEMGKQAVCLVELKARFDERANISWARKLERAGVHVVYGMPGIKIHAKCVLVVRREGDGVRRYVHVGTG
ncbi:MAG: polyphosphate kinase 1, partial [Actinobacteria bacterium]|nr:polyphosphate kinase 1 [Actinomycetota bacterium]